MFHKRLMKEFADNNKYVAGMMAAQWISMLANAGMMWAVAGYLGRLLTGENPEQGYKWMGSLFLAFVVCLCLRSFASTVNSRLSFAASEKVKIRLREAVYEKLMQLGPSYRKRVTTAEAVQISKHRSAVLLPPSYSYFPQ